jgi:hypothetical protein
VVEGVEVNLFSERGLLLDAWLFRDPMDFEVRVSLPAQQQKLGGDGRRAGGWRRQQG